MQERRRQKIGSDLDGCIADFMQRFTETMAGLFPFNPNIPYGSKDHRAYPHMVDEERSISLEMATKTWDKLSQTPNWWRQIPPCADRGELAALAKLAEHHEVTAITARKLDSVPASGLSLMAQTRDWLDSLWQYHMGLMFTLQKGVVSAAMRLDWFLEDAPENATDIADRSPSTKVCLLKRHYNVDLEDSRIIRVQSVKEFINLVERED